MCPVAQRADILFPDVVRMLRDESKTVRIAAANVVYELRYSALKHRGVLESIVDSLDPECAQVVRMCIEHMVELEKRLSEPQPRLH
jgi:hypothetical protein